MVSSSSTTTTPAKFGVRFLTRKERTVRRVTKYETREIQKRLEPPKPARVRPPPKPKAPKKTPLPATLCKPPKAPRTSASRSNHRSNNSENVGATSSNSSSSTPSKSSASSSNKSCSSLVPRTLQAPDLTKLARLNCSREFSLFHQFIKAELGRSYENQLAFLQTKLQHLKNEFVNKQAEHLNFEQIRDYYNEAVQENIRRRIKPDEYLTLADKLKQDAKQAIDKWLRKKELKPQRQVTEYLQRRQARIRDRIKETLEEVKKQQQQQTPAEAETEEQNETEINSATTTTELSMKSIEITTIDDDDDVMIID